MRKDSQHKETIAKLSRTDLILLRSYVTQNQHFRNSIQAAITDLNQRFGDFNVYLLMKNLENHNLQVYTDDNEHLEFLKEVIGKSACSDILKNALLKNISVSNYDQKITIFLNIIKKYQREDIVILAEKCAENGTVLREDQLLHLTLKLKNMSGNSEAPAEEVCNA
ncbi:MAG: hypothetical protein K2X50_09510 [Gammaproteobacteria bacterium]|nr:hypothetical protein [Gammaproteobacteria bacterium]